MSFVDASYIAINRCRTSGEVAAELPTEFVCALTLHNEMQVSASIDQSLDRLDHISRIGFANNTAHNVNSA